jgi:hypothetical protein
MNKIYIIEQIIHSCRECGNIAMSGKCCAHNKIVNEPYNKRKINYKKIPEWCPLKDEKMSSLNKHILKQKLKRS